MLRRPPWFANLGDQPLKRTIAAGYAPPVPRRERQRREESQAQTREALMEAAGRLFDAQGFAATSIADIADEAGYTTGALYSNFASKEDLFLAVLERGHTMELSALQEALSREETISGRLQVVGTWYASKAGRGGQRTRAFAELALLGGREAEHARLRDQRKLVHQSVAALLRQQEAELGIRFQLPAPTLATAALALLEGFALGSLIDDEVDPATVVAGLEMLLQPAKGARQSQAPAPDLPETRATPVSPSPPTSG